MKKMFCVALCAIGFAMLFPGCKTTEENYQRAYEAARAKRTEGLTKEEIDGFKREEAMPKTVFKGDSIPLKGMYVRWVDGGVGKTALRYNVVVASFRQQFNARSVFERLKNAGHDRPVLLSDAAGRFYVCALTTASLDTAVMELKKLSESSPVVLKDPFPYILQKP